VFAPCKGLIVSIATIPLIRTGDPLVHLVLIKKTFDRIKKILEENEDCECEEELVNDEEGIPLDDMVFEMSEKTEPK
ncbi:MAG: hypothetical protein VYE59_04990, partial [Candidatus Thermoplasmatota archaeon]|nr:hypothetical protein [Candidatus Thermoplasmatota archaeon]